MASLPIYDKMGKIVLDDIRDKFKRPEEARCCLWKPDFSCNIHSEKRGRSRDTQLKSWFRRFFRNCTTDFTHCNTAFTVWSYLLVGRVRPVVSTAAPVDGKYPSWLATLLIVLYVFFGSEV